MEAYNLDTLKLLDHVGVARSNMIAAYHNASATRKSMQHRKRDLGPICSRFERNKQSQLRKVFDGLIYRPEQYKATANYRYSPRVYALDERGKDALRGVEIIPSEKIDLKNPWHQLMLSDVIISLAIECKERGLRFRFQKDIIGNEQLSFISNISYEFPKGPKHSNRRLEPDYLFAIEDMYIALEIDRSTETLMAAGFENKSHLRSVLQYRNVFATKEYEKFVPNMVLLTVTTNTEHARNIRQLIIDLGFKSSRMMVVGVPILGASETYPAEPVKLLDAPLLRAGYPDFNIGDALGRTSKTASTLHDAR
jgi:hypothetical protein